MGIWQKPTKPRRSRPGKFAWHVRELLEAEFPTQKGWRYGHPFDLLNKTQVDLWLIERAAQELVLVDATERLLLTVDDLEFLADYADEIGGARARLYLPESVSVAPEVRRHAEMLDVELVITGLASR